MAYKRKFYWPYIVMDGPHKVIKKGTLFTINGISKDGYVIEFDGVFGKHFVSFEILDRESEIAINREALDLNSKE